MALSPIVAQAILGQRAPDIVGQFQAGQQQRQQREAQQRQQQAQQLTGQFLQEQFAGTRLAPLAAAGVGQEKLFALAQGVGIPVTERGRLEDFGRNIQVARGLAQKDPEQAAQFMSQVKANLNLRGIESPLVDEAMLDIRRDPVGFVEDISLLEGAFRDAGLITETEAQKAAREAAAKTEAAKALEEQKQEARITERIRKDTAASIDRDVRTISDESAALETNFAKVNNLATRIKSGNRASVSQGLIALVKLGEPSSAVLTGEMLAQLNKKNPVAAVASLLTDKGVSGDVIDSITSKIDPLDPFSINTEDILDTAQAIVSARIPTLQQQLVENQQRATENLTAAGARAVLPSSRIKRIERLSKLLPQQPAAQPAPRALEELTPQDLSQLTDEQLAQLAGGQ